MGSKSGGPNPEIQFKQWAPHPEIQIRNSKSKDPNLNYESQNPEFKPCSPDPTDEVNALVSTSITANPICGIQILKPTSGGGSISKVWNQIPKPKIWGSKSTCLRSKMHCWRQTPEVQILTYKSKFWSPNQEIQILKSWQDFRPGISA